MCKKIFYFLMSMALALSIDSALAATSVATIPDGMMVFSLPHGTSTCLSLPLTWQPTYAGTVVARVDQHNQCR